MPNLQNKNLPVRLTYAPHPFKIERRFMTLEPGNSLQDMLVKIQPDPILRYQAIISLDGNIIQRKLWSTTVPKQGSLVVIRVLPAGGGSGGGGKIIRSILTVVVAIAAIAVSALTYGALSGPMGAMFASFAAGLAGMTTGIIGNLVLNALIPPSAKGALSKPTDAMIEQTSPMKYIEGARNQISRWGAVPRLFGYTRVVPLKCASDFTDIIGFDQYVTCMFTFGYAKVQISDLKIGETDLDDFVGVDKEYRNLTYAIGATTTVYGGGEHELYKTDVNEEFMSIHLTSDVWNLRTTQLGATSIEIDLTFPNGLYSIWIFYNNPYKLTMTATFRVEYREWTKEGDGIWEAFDWSYSTMKTTTFRIGKRWDVNPTNDPEKKYEVRIRTQYGGDSDYIYRQAWWTNFKSYKTTYPLNFPHDLSTMAVRIKASDQLTGTLDEFNCMAKSILLDWDSSAATWTERITNNPASIFRSILQDVANPNPLDDSRLDLEKIQYWHEYCTTKGWAYNKVVDAQTSIYNLLGEVAAAGRAAICEYDSKWSVVLDEEQTAPAQIFTPRNSWDLDVSLTYPDMPHGLRCSFNNEQKDYQKDERFVLDDGYQVDGVDAWGHNHPEYPQATKFEQIDLPAITNPDNIFKFARYHLAAAKLRPRTITFKCDFEHLAVTRGDLVHLAHDVMLIGLGSGRIKSLILDESNNLVGVTTDSLFEMNTATDYCLRFRISDLTTISLQKQVVSEDGDDIQSFTFTDAIPEGELMPSVGDLFVFGELDSEVIPAIINNITTSSDLTATITCVDAATAIHRADIGTIPKFDSGITIPYEWAAPIINNVRSDVGVMYLDGLTNTWKVCISVDIHHYSRKTHPFPNGIEISYWLLDSELQNNLYSNDINTVIISPVDTSSYYQFKLRYNYTDGTKSKWSEIVTHRVVGITDIPNITNLVTFYSSNLLYLKWDAIAKENGYPGIEYEIRKGTTWNTSEVLGVVNVNQFPAYGDGDYWVSGKVESAYSGTATGIEITGSTNMFNNLYIEIDEYAGGWTGTFDNTTVNGLDFLELSGVGLFDAIANLDLISDLDLEGGIAASGYYTTSANNIVDLGEAQSCNVLTSIKSISVDLYSNVFDCPDFDNIVNFDGDIASLTYAKAQIAIATTTIFGDWQDFIPGYYYGRKFNFRAKLVTSSPATGIPYVTPMVEEFKWYIDMPDRIESSTYDLGISGNTISYSKPFHIIPSPIISVYNASVGDEVFITSKTTANFFIQVKNSGVGVARTIHWAAKAY